MIIEDGILENVSQIRGPEYTEGPKWRVELLPELTYGSPRRPKLWTRFWQRVLFGWKWEYK